MLQGTSAMLRPPEARRPWAMLAALLLLLPAAVQSGFEVCWPALS
jgi:hypothetical protein